MKVKKKTKLKFSIVVVSLNTKTKVLKTINSIKSQNYKNYEIIIVDGQSSDGTINFIKKNKKIFSKIIIEKDKGIYDAMNKGVKHSSGEWIFFLNSGDIFYSKKTLINISNKLNNSFDFIYGNVAIQRNGFKNILPSSDFNLSSLIIPFSHQGIFSKKKLFRKKKFNLNFKIASDFEFFYFYLKKNKKFLKVNYTISTLETLGLSDTKRLSAFNEYEKIAIRYSNSTFIRVKFFLFKVRVLLIHFLKLLLPNDFLKLLIYLKYSKLT